MFSMQVMFKDLAFLRFSVIDVGTNHVLSQRVMPLKCLRPGYRHIRLRTPQNQPLQLSTLFIFSRMEEEGLDLAVLENGDASMPLRDTKSARARARSREIITMLDGGHALTDTTKDHSMSLASQPSVPLKRRMFFLMVYGVMSDEPYTILKITQESTTQDVIVQALQKSGRGSEQVHDYVLVEEVARSWEKKDRTLPATQRVLDQCERPLQAQAQWQGEGRFILKRMGDDPSSRAWLSSIRSTAGRSASSGASGDESTGGNGQMRGWEEHETFLVCVYNVSPEIPYAILKVPVNSSAQDVLAQALVKARRLEDPSRFVLMEELEWGPSPSSGPGSGGDKGSASTVSRRRHRQRVLPDDQNVYMIQAHWQTLGRFILKERDRVTPPSRHRGGNFRERLSKGLARLEREKLPVGEALSDPTARKGVGASRREVHSEGETLSDEEMDEGRDTDVRSTVARLKKVSLRKFKVWK